MFDLTGRVALVTGAGQGVGAAIARVLAEAGAAVAVNDVVAERAEAAAGHIASLGGRAVPVVGDLTDPKQVREVVRRTSSELGPVAVLVNNAGVPVDGFRLVPFVDTVPADWDPYLALNVGGVLHCTHAVLPGMLEAGWGRVVSIVSDAPRVGERGTAAYAASKAAAIGFTRVLAAEVGAAGVTANCVALGRIDTGVGATAAGPADLRGYAVPRVGQPDDVAPAVLWLSSDEAAWVTGQTVTVNGGYVLR